jgi:hypothetical protein
MGRGLYTGGGAGGRVGAHARLATWAPRGFAAPQAHVFKAFNQSGFENLGDVRVYARKPAMFVAGDSETLKPAVLRLASDAGFEAIDAGGLRVARLLEPLAMPWIALAAKRGMGTAFAFALERTGSLSEAATRGLFRQAGASLGARLALAAAALAVVGAGRAVGLAGRELHARDGSVGWLPVQKGHDGRSCRCLGVLQFTCSGRRGCVAEQNRQDDCSNRAHAHAFPPFVLFARPSSFGRPILTRRQSRPLQA